MPKAIFRLAKLKTWGAIAASGGHVTRSRSTPNADLTRENQVLMGNAEGLLVTIQQRLHNSERTIRKDAVLAVDMFFGASPEYFRPSKPTAAGTWAKHRLKLWVEATTKFLDEQFGQTVVSAVLHLDESTPHIQVHMVPMRNTQTGETLSYKDWFGSPQKLRQWQDAYALAVKHLGIERGVEGSQATHTAVKEYYEQVNQPIPELPDLTLELCEPEILRHIAPTTMERLSFNIAKYGQRVAAEERQHWQGVVNDYHQRVQQVIAPLHTKATDRERATVRAEQMTLTAVALQEHYQQQEQLLQQRERELAHREQQAQIKEKQFIARDQLFKNQADQLRALALTEVALALGLEQDTGQAADLKRWRLPGSVISINEPKFHDHLQNKGGGGAIDLVMHIQQCEYKEALLWLKRTFGNSRAGVTIVAQVTEVPFRPPTPNVEAWSAAQAYLSERGICDEQWLADFYGKRIIWADAQQNLVFARHQILWSSPTDELQRGQIVGASLRGTHGTNNQYKGLVAGSRRSEGWFWFGNEQPQRVMITESPIDALSLRWLWAEEHDDDALYISTDGAGDLPLRLLEKLQAQGIKLIAAHDADVAGDQMAKRFSELFPQAERLRPTNGKDWNEQLQRYQAELAQQEQDQQEEQQEEEMEY